MRRAASYGSFVAGKGDRAMIREHYLEDVLRQLQKYEDLAEAAIRQVTDEELFRALDGDSNSVARVRPFELRDYSSVPGRISE
jgi:hypothetical protein